jgi:hypothetical protein
MQCHLSISPFIITPLKRHVLAPQYGHPAAGQSLKLFSSAETRR